MLGGMSSFLPSFLPPSLPFPPLLSSPPFLSPTREMENATEIIIKWTDLAMIWPSENAPSYKN